MARPIADTPVLTGMDALRFMERMENVKKMSPKRRQEIAESYKLFKQKATFAI